MAVTTNLYPQAQQDALNGNINFSSHTFKVALIGNKPYTATDLFYSDISFFELPGQFGYTTGGATLTNQKVNTNFLTGLVAFDADDLVWTANGGALGPIYKAVIYDTTYQNRLIASIDFGAPNTVGNGAPFTIQWNDSGIISFTGLS